MSKIGLFIFMFKLKFIGLHKIQKNASYCFFIPKSNDFCFRALKVNKSFGLVNFLTVKLACYENSV